jgi:hypothetical protein
MEIRLVVPNWIEVGGDIRVFFVDFFMFGIKECLMMKLADEGLDCFFTAKQGFTSLLRFSMCLFG